MSHHIIMPLCHSKFMLGICGVLCELKNLETIPLVLYFSPLNAKLNPTFHLLALLGAHHIFHISGLRVNFNFCVPLKSR